MSLSDQTNIQSKYLIFHRVLYSPPTNTLGTGTCGYHSIPSSGTGLPACAQSVRDGNGGKCENNGATALVMLRSKITDATGTPGVVVFDVAIN